MNSLQRIWSSFLAVCFCFLPTLLCNDTIHTETLTHPVTVNNNKIPSVSKIPNDFSSFQIDRVAAQESYFFIKKIFEHYGDNDKLTLDSLASLFEKLGLITVEESHDHRHRRDVPNQAAVKAPRSELSTSTFPVKSSLSDVLDNVTSNSHFHDEHNQCLNPKELLSAFDFPDNKDLTKQHFLYLSPAMLFQSAFCEKMSSDNHQHDTHDHSLKSIKSVPFDKTKHTHVHEEHEHDHNHSDVAKQRIPSPSSTKVWGFSAVAVVIISLVGLLGVAVIPVMQKVFYNHLLQFLVALAVGALSGDALLHLLPHAMNEHDHAHENTGMEDHTAVYKGLLALSGMFLFFFVERLLTIFTDYKRKRRQKKKETHKYNKETLLPKDESKVEAVGAKLSNDPDYTSCEEMMMVVHSSKESETHFKCYHDDLWENI